MFELGHHSDVLVFLLAAILVVIIFQRLKISPVLGYLIAGVVIGPFVTNMIDSVETSRSLAEFGVVFLLFTIGLELPWERLRELKRLVFGLGALQFFITSVVIGSIVYWLSFSSLEMAILMGGGLALSSTAVVLQVLSDRKELSTTTGRTTFSVLLFQDLAVVFLIVWINSITKSEGSLLASLGDSLLKAIVFFILMMLVGRFVLRPLYRLVAYSRNPELFMATTLLVVLATSMATGALGLSMELGAFLAGLMLAETAFRHQIEADIKPFRALLLGLFFMTVGMSIDPGVFTDDWLFILIAVVAIITVKCSIFYGLARLLKLPAKTALKSGLLLSTGGEFIFVLFSQAVEANIVTTELMQIINLAVIITMCFTPFLAMLGKMLGQKMPTAIGIGIKAASEESKDLKNHVIIAGYGKVGETVHNLLAKHMVAHTILDLNTARVTIGRKNSIPIFFGDARRSEVFRALGADRAKAVVLTMSDFASSTRAVMTLRRYFPNVEVFVRVQDSEQAFRLREVGAHPIMPETFAPSFQLVSAILSLYGMSADQIDETIKEFRTHYLSASSFEHGEVPWISSSFDEIGGVQKK